MREIPYDLKYKSWSDVDEEGRQFYHNGNEQIDVN